MIAAIAIDSPVGRLTVSATTEAIVAIGWRDEPVGDPNGLLHEARRQLEAYFAGQLQVFDLPLAPAGSRHDQLVWGAGAGGGLGAAGGRRCLRPQPDPDRDPLSPGGGAPWHRRL